MTGLVHIYTGNGKGKTTAAIGLGIRAYGRGLKVLMIQFLKGGQTGEIGILEKLEPNFKFKRANEIKGFFWNLNEEEIKSVKKSTDETFYYIINAVSTGEWDVLILDEVMGAISNSLIDTEDLVAFIKNKPASLEVVLTGRNAPQELVDLADYVSEIKPIKHPYDKGIHARKGIEF